MLRLFFILIIISMLIPPAFADWLDYLPWRAGEKGELLVCIFEPEDEEIKRNYVLEPTMTALGKWDEGLEKYTNSKNYNIINRYIPLEDHENKTYIDFYYCDVTITYYVEKREGVREEAIGVAYQYQGQSHIEVYPIHFINLTVTKEDKSDIFSFKIKKTIPQQAIESVIMHEFGHTIGLGHLCNEPYGHKFKSVMQAHFNPFTETLEITEYDLAAVYHKYGKEGWNKDAWLPYKYGSQSEFFRGTVNCTI